VTQWTQASLRQPVPVPRCLLSFCYASFSQNSRNKSSLRSVSPFTNSIRSCEQVHGRVRPARGRDATFVALAYGGALALDGLVKIVFHSARPHLWASPTPETGYGFPSGHAMGSMGLLAARVALAWSTRWRWPAHVAGVLAIAAIGLSRLYLGAHYPSDVLGAWAAALAWVIGLRLVLLARASARPMASGSSL